MIFPQVPGTFTLSMRYYTDNICWIKNTYYIPLEETIPNKDEEITSEINYYQWVPIVLVLQALAFYMPYMVSRECHHLPLFVGLPDQHMKQSQGYMQKWPTESFDSAFPRVRQ